MSTISLCMIVKNEEDVLARCLESISDLVDEIIIVDTGSTDKTRDIAKQFTDKVYDFVWIHDFAAARNYSFSLAQMEYCMWLDADDVILEDDRQVFIKLKNELSNEIFAVQMKYHTAFDKQGKPTFSYFRERLIRNHAGMLWKGAVHEVIETAGKVIHWECAVTHRKEHPTDPDRNLNIFLRLIENGTKLEPRQQFYYGRELYYHQKYKEAVTVFEQFLSDGNGWIENNIDACRHCAYCQYALEHEQDALRSLLHSFVYDSPRAETCCDIAKHFFDRNQFQIAIDWYKTALHCHRKDDNGGFVSSDCYDYLPCIQLCVCFSRLGDYEKALAFNELAANFKPEDAAVLWNREYFTSLEAQKS